VENDSANQNPLDELLSWFDTDRDRASALYMELRKRLVFYFRFYYNPEDLADETIDRVLEKFKEGKIKRFGRAENYIWGVARNLRNENSRKRKVFSFDDAVLDEPLKEPATWTQHDEDEDLYKAIKTAINNLDEADRELFLEYVFIDERDGKSRTEMREELAAKHKINIPNLRVKIYRIKKNLMREISKS